MCSWVYALRLKTHIFICVYIYLNASFAFKKLLVVLKCYCVILGSALKLVLGSIGELLWEEAVVGLEQLFD